ncbi:MAG: gluconokinase, partial [Panacibacter sp.]
IVNELAQPLHTFKLPVVSVQNKPGQYEQDAEAIFQSLTKLLQQSLAVAQEKDIACVAFSAAMHSLLAVNKAGIPLCNALTWADTQSKAYAHQLKSSAACENIYMQTGTPIHAMSPLCKIAWIKNEQPELFANTHKFISIKEYIFHRLFRKYVVDAGIASSSGMLDIYNVCWHKEALEFAGIDESRLSQVVPATHSESLLFKDIKGWLNLTLPIPFVTGGNDGCLANLGCGALNNNEAALTIGTSGAVRVTIPKPLQANQEGLFRYMLTKDLYVTGGPINNGGIALQWFAENFLSGSIQSPEDFSAFMQLAAKAPPTANGLVFLPYLLGERAPVWDEDATGMFYGLRLSHSKEHLTRAVIEGISFSLLQILHATEAANIEVNKVLVSGIVTQSHWWMQLLADIFGKTIILSDQADASAMGAAFMGMYAMGIIDDLSTVKKFIQIAKTFEPDAGTHALYQKHFQVYASLYPKFKTTL